MKVADRSKKSRRDIRILLSEGSSTNARECITALGRAGYRVDLVDPNPFCMGRFSRYVRRVFRCPISGQDPEGYLRFVTDLIQREHYQVLFPANEQAYLFSWASGSLTPITGLAVADFSAFKRVQTKGAFIRTLDGLGIAHPETKFAHSWEEIEAASQLLAAPFFIKTSYGTASIGVWRVNSPDEMPQIWSELSAQGLLDGRTEFLIQAGARGQFEQSHAIFDRGRLIALRCTRRLLEGAQGGAAVKLGVDRPCVRQDFELLGSSLDWHGSLSIDYFWDNETGQAAYIDANPRITEPVNALVNGVNLADMQVRLSLYEEQEPVKLEITTMKSHNLLQVMFGAAEARHSRWDVVREVGRVLFRRGVYCDSQEGMTPFPEDLPSLFVLLVAFIDLMINPASSKHIALDAISNYSLGAAITRLENQNPQEAAVVRG